jgi:hypothetical protein
MARSSSLRVVAPGEVHRTQGAPNLLDRAAQASTDWPLWQTAATAARYLDFQHCADPVDAFRRFAKRVGLVPRGRRGDVPLFLRSDLDAAVSVVHEVRR